MSKSWVFLGGLLWGWVISMWVMLLSPSSVVCWTTDYQRGYAVGENDAANEKMGWHGNPFSYGHTAYYGWRDGFNRKRTELIFEKGRSTGE